MPQLPTRPYDIPEGFKTISSELSMACKNIESWAGFREWADAFLPARWCFRGHADSAWGLRPTLERLIRGNHTGRGVNPVEVESILMRKFRRQVRHFLAETPPDDDLVGWFALMQHHGAPTRLLDFTLSPYVALFFAMLGSMPNTGCASVWAFNYVRLQRIASRNLPDGIAHAIVPGWEKGPLEFRDVFNGLLRNPQRELRFVAPSSTSIHERAPRGPTRHVSLSLRHNARVRNRHGATGFRAQC